MAAAWRAERQHGTAALVGDIPHEQLAQFVTTLDSVLARLRTDTWSNADTSGRTTTS
jgi:hypothetical protein